jgi:hypothetical protein
MKNKTLFQSTSYDNNVIHSLSRFYGLMLSQVNGRKAELESGLSSKLVQIWTRLAGRFAGRRPSLHCETGLIDRTIKAGYGKKIIQFSSPDTADFDQSLQKSEDLMKRDLPFNGDKRRLIAAAHRVYDACRFPNRKFRPVSVKYAAENQINISSSSGFPDFKRKGHVIEKLIYQAVNCLKYKWLDPFNWPITRGFRIQIRKALDGLNLKVRVMYPYPGVLILLEDTYIMPFVSHFIDTDSFYVIGRSGSDISKLLKQKLKNVKGRITTTDISAFDQNVLNDFSILAFGILRNQLQLTANENKIFMEIVKYFCVSYAVSKLPKQPAYCFIKKTGVPSGSGFTNMVDTLVHAIALEYCEPGILSQGRTLICGDDVIFDSTHTNLDVFSNMMETHCNLPIQWEKSKHFPNWKKISFLGFDWINGVRIQDEQLLINQLIWHPDFRTDLSKVDRELSRGASVLLNAYNGILIFRKIFPDVITNLDRGVDVRFNYMHGTQPPTTLPGVLGYVKPQHLTYEVPHSNVSLIEHLKDGWKIR